MLPPPWMIEELEKLRKERETEDQRLPLYIERGRPYSDEPEEETPVSTSRVIIIEL